jgi:hypothetical protein
MRSVFTAGRARWPVWLALVVTLLGSAVYADDPNPFAPPEAKIGPPPGLQSSTTTQATVELSYFDLFWIWLEIQAKIGPPAG